MFGEQTQGPQLKGVKTKKTKKRGEIPMRKRFKMGRKKSKRHFTSNAMRVHGKNTLSTTSAGPMRGGIRL